VGDIVLQATKCINISQFNRVTCILWRIAGSGVIQAAQMYAADTVAGGNITAITSTLQGSTSCGGLIATADGTNATGLVGALGCGMIIMETTASEVDKVLANADFVTARANFATAGDELGMLWILSEPRYPKAGLTANGSA
jgi:hypothetical protein